MTPRVVVIGLGPAGPELMTAAAIAAIDAVSTRFVRTWRHPSADALGDAQSFDHVYESVDSMGDVYPAIVEHLVAAAIAHDEVLYAVPGSPRVAEQTVELLEADPRVDVEVVPALSFLDLAWVRLGIDPLVAGVLLVDGHSFVEQTAGSSGPFLVAQCDSPAVLSEVKIAVDAPPAFEALVLHHLGLPEESISAVPWEELDRVVEPDHLTSVFVPAIGNPVAPEFARFQDLVLTLRRECPWDAEQTHESLRPHLLEETYEVLEAIDRLSADDSADAYIHLEEELGDLLYQVFFHAALAAEEGHFGVGDVADGIHDKLRRRHPHVFGDVAVGDADQVLTNWEAIKRKEKQRESVLDGIPPALPALMLASKVQAKSGLEPELELAEAARAAETANETAAELAVGQLLQAVVALSRKKGLDAELALHNAATALADRYRVAEAAAAAEGVDLAAADAQLRARYL